MSDIDRSANQGAPPRGITGFALRCRWVVLLALLGSTLFFALQLKKIRLAANPLDSMYPSGHPFLSTLRAIEKMAPEPRMIVGILDVKDGDIYDPATIEKVGSITTGLMEIEGVLPDKLASLTRGMDHYEHTSEGLSIGPVLGVKWPETREEFAELKRKVAVNPMGLGRYVAYDHTATMITAMLADPAGKAKRAYRQLSDEERAKVSLDALKSGETDRFNAALVKSLAALQAKENDSRHTLQFMGPEVIAGQMTEMGLRQIPIALAEAVLLIVAVLAVRLRTLGGVLVPLVAMVISVVWVLGLFALTGVELNPMAIFFPLILGLLTLVFSGLAMDRYHLACRAGEDRLQAIMTAHGGARLSASILAAGFVLMSLGVATVPMLRDSARLVAFWTVSALAAVIGVGPILLSLLPRPRAATKEKRSTPATAATAKPAGRGGRFLRVAVLLSILALGGLSASRLVFGGNVPGTTYIRPDHPWNRCFNLFDRKFMGPYQLLVYVKAREEGGLLNPEAIQAISDFSDFLKDECGAKDSIAFDMMIRMARAMLMDGNPKWLTVPETRRQVEALARLVMEQGGVESFMDSTFTQGTISPFFPGAATKRIDELAAKMQKYIEAHPSEGLRFSLGGGLLGMTSAIDDGSRASYSRTVGAAFLALIVAAAATAGSVPVGLLVAGSIAAAQAVVWAAMAATGIPISLPILPATVVAVGFGAVIGLTLVHNAPRAAAVPGLLFAAALIFAGCLPWSFVGLKFQADMIVAVGCMVMVEAVACAVLLPPMLDSRNGRAWHPARTS